jgi:AcrR family transcriptional regulator
LQWQLVVAILGNVEDEVGPARRTRGARTGGRSERVVASVLQAALAELARVGYATLRLEDVAARAGVAKTTIYRRWPTKADLVRAALHEGGRYDDPLPDTGSLRTDLLAMLEHRMKMVATPEGRALARMVTMEGGDPEVEALCRQLKDESQKLRAQLVVRAQERGELPPEADPILITDCVFVLVMSRLIRYGEMVDRATCERLIDLVVTGAEHGGGQRAPEPPRAAPRLRQRG